MCVQCVERSASPRVHDETAHAIARTSFEAQQQTPFLAVARAGCAAECVLHFGPDDLIGADIGASSERQVVSSTDIAAPTTVMRRPRPPLWLGPPDHRTQEVGALSDAQPVIQRPHALCPRQALTG